MLSSLIKTKLIERLATLPFEGSPIKEVETDFLIKMNNNVIGYGYNYITDSDPAKWYGVPEWFKLSKSISAKISLLSREYPDAFCFLKQPSRIIYLPQSINIELISQCCLRHHMVIL